MAMRGEICGNSRAGGEWLVIAPHNARYRLRGMRTQFLQSKKMGSNPHSHHKKEHPRRVLFFMAERMGFEPMKPVRVYTISSRAP